MAFDHEDRLFLSLRLAESAISVTSILQKVRRHRSTNLDHASIQRNHRHHPLLLAHPLGQYRVSHSAHTGRQPRLPGEGPCVRTSKKGVGVERQRGWVQPVGWTLRAVPLVVVAAMPWLTTALVECEAARDATLLRRWNQGSLASCTWNGVKREEGAVYVAPSNMAISKPNVEDDFNGGLVHSNSCRSLCCLPALHWLRKIRRKLSF